MALGGHPQPAKLVSLEQTPRLLIHRGWSTSMFATRIWLALLSRSRHAAGRTKKCPSALSAQRLYTRQEALQADLGLASIFRLKTIPSLIELKSTIKGVGESEPGRSWEGIDEGISRTIAEVRYYIWSRSTSWIAHPVRGSTKAEGEISLCRKPARFNGIRAVGALGTVNVVPAIKCGIPAR